MSGAGLLRDALLDLPYPIGRGRLVTLRALLNGEREALTVVAAEARKRAAAFRKEAAGLAERALLLEQAAALQGRAASTLTAADRDTLERAAELLIPGLAKMKQTVRS